MNFDASMYNSGLMLEDKPKPSELDRDYQKIPKRPYERDIQVQCFPLYSVLKALNISAVDYFSLDIEGAEFVVLNTIPWEKVNMTLLSIETNHAGDIFPGSRKDIEQFLDDKGFELVETAEIDDFFLNKMYNKKKTRKIKEKQKKS